MKTSILATKTGKMNMGGYIKEKTAIVYKLTFTVNGVDQLCNYFRFKYIHDSCDECFDTLDKAMSRFNNVPI